jgi:DeoR/GlpR family transcriptional regulator of sugar metabolism
VNGAAMPGTAEAASAPAFTEERRAEIVRLVKERGRVRTGELAGILGVTEPTIRRDVADLDRQGLVHRTHGGAIAASQSREPSLSARAGRNVAAKAAIARACLDLIEDGGAVFLDSGSSVDAIADAIRESAVAPGTGDLRGRFADLNVLTNAVGVAVRLADVPGVRCTLLGGSYRTLGACTVGPLAVDNLAQFSLTAAFIGVTGLFENTFAVSDMGDAQLKIAAMARAATVVVPMDSSKVGVVDFRRICDLDRVDVLVTERPVGDLTERCAAATVELVVAG